ncbi:hypothetical protein ACWFRJ_43865 [Streptomyces sp. NPDC055239]
MHATPSHPDSSAVGNGRLARRGMLAGLTAAAVLVPTATASATPRQQRLPAGPTIQAVASATGIELSTQTVPAGPVTLSASTTEPKQQPLGLIRLRPDTDLDTFLVHYKTAATATDPATRRAALAQIDSEAHYFGGVAVTSASGTVSVSWILAPGTYHLINYTTVDPASPEIGTRTLRVGPPERRPLQPWSPTQVIAPYDDGPDGRFLTASVLTAKGTFQVVNHSAQLNEVMLYKATAEATTETVTACMEALRQGKEPPLFPFTGMPTGLTPISPGASAVLSLSLKPGRYLMTSFISNRTTLTKRAFEGMWQLVTLR